MGKLTTGMRDLKASQEHLGTSVGRLHDAVGRLHEAVAPIAAAREAAKAADAACALRAELRSPSTIQAANQARWPRR